jgi:Arc/MetJ-type ribon-helix-helix transcriptional regulator
VNRVQLQLTKEQQEFIRRAIQSGRIHSAEAAVKEALALWVERERRREEILVAIDEAEASLARGEDIIITKPSMRELAEDVKHRGRVRLAEEEKRIVATQS